MQKPSTNSSFVQKFPDSNRGEMKGRASFLGAPPEIMGAKEEEPTFKSLEKQTVSPTKGGKVPFNKTPRAKMGSSDGEHVVVVQDSEEHSDDEEKHDKARWKHIEVYRLVMSKLRNRR